MAIQITSIERAQEGLWSGMAIKDGIRLRWFIELDGDSFDVMEEDVACRHIGKDGGWRYCFLCINPPDGAKEAILEAIRRGIS
jgi:hypothetical protein